jgi:hypothetical protein
MLTAWVIYLSVRQLGVNCEQSRRIFGSFEPGPRDPTVIAGFKLNSYMGALLARPFWARALFSFGQVSASRRGRTIRRLVVNLVNDTPRWDCIYVDSS